MSMPWPEDLGSGTVLWDLGFMKADNDDPDRSPQLTAGTGITVNFSPDVSQAVRYNGVDGNKTIIPLLSQGIINEEGLLCTMKEDGTPDVVGVVLPATDSETMTPRDWTYTVTVLDNRIIINRFSISLATGAEIDLAEYAPVDSSGGTHIVTEVETARRAETAAGQAETFRNETRTDRQAAQTARTGAETARDQAGTHATASASSASTAADILEQMPENADTRLTQIETMAGLEPGEVTDAQTANLLGRSETLTRQSLDTAVEEETELLRSRSHQALPLQGVTVESREVGQPIPIEFFRGILWGVDSHEIYISTDQAQTWEYVGDNPGGRLPQRILPSGTDEILVFDTQGGYKSSGLFTDNLTWNQVLENNTASVMYPWGIKGDGSKFIVTHYSGSGISTPDRADSRYVWISLDGGETWEVKWDTQEIFGEELNALTHIHAVEYDAWEDRFFVSEGHVEATGVYVSYDDGDNWERLEYDDSFHVPPGNSPTTATATDLGIVFGSDDPTNGLMVLKRGNNTISRVYSRLGISSGTLLGYAHHASRDPRTGMVYHVWERNVRVVSGLPAEISASDGLSGSSVYVFDNPDWRLWRRIVVDNQGNLWAWEQTQNVIAHGKVGGEGAQSVTLADSGKVLSGKATGASSSIAAGLLSEADGVSTTAYGYAAKVEGGLGTGIGAHSEVSGSGTAIGAQSSSGAAGVALGWQAETTNGTSIGSDSISRHAGSTAIGRDSRVQTLAGVNVADGTAIGRSAHALHQNATVIGRSATSGGIGAVAIGRNTLAGASAVAIGYESEATHLRSVAIGRETETTSNNQVAFGDRDIELQGPGRGVILQSPNGSAWKLTVSDDGQLTVEGV